MSGCIGHYTGTIIRQPDRHRPNSDRQSEELTEKELALNKEINSTRAVVKHTIGMIKRYRITIGPFWSTSEEFDDEFNIIFELVNLNLD